MSSHSVALILHSYRSILTLIRVREEDSGNYTLRVENGNQSHEISLNLVVKGQEENFILPNQ